MRSRQQNRENMPLFLKNTKRIQRSGVRKLLEQLHKKEEAYQKELLRTEKMKEFERKYEDLGYVCGIDEVGRARWQVLL